MFKKFNKIVVIGLIALLAIGGIGIIYNMASTGLKAINAPIAVMNKALDTNNVKHKYEWFHDTYNVYLTRTVQVKQFKEFYAEETSPNEKRKLRMELAGIEQVCRDLVAKYNANSNKLNVSIFKGWSLPESLLLGSC